MSRPAPGLAVRAAPCDAHNHTSTNRLTRQPTFPIGNDRKIVFKSGVAAPVARRPSAVAPLQASIKLKGAPSPTAEHRSARIGGHDWQGLYIPSRPWHVDMLSNILESVCVCDSLIRLSCASN